jgi:hypothetical protein
VTLETHIREKDGDGSTQMTAALATLGAGATVCTLLKEKLDGTFVKVRRRTAMQKVANPVVV